MLPWFNWNGQGHAPSCNVMMCKKRQMEINCQGLVEIKMHLRLMRHPGIPNHRSGSRRVFMTRHQRASQMETRFWNTAHFWRSSVTLRREAGNATPQFSSAAPDLPRRREECLHAPLLDAPPHRLLSLKTSLADPVTYLRPRWLTRDRWATLRPRLGKHRLFRTQLCYLFLCLLLCLSLFFWTRLGGCVLGQELLQSLDMRKSFVIRDVLCESKRNLSWNVTQLVSGCNMVKSKGFMN